MSEREIEMSEQTIDAQGLSCPMPIVKLTKAAKQLSAGDTVTLLADDPGFEPDIEAWVEVHGHKLLSFTEADGVLTAVIEIT